jgi:transposase
MQVKTILNQCYKFKSFVYTQVRFVAEQGERFIEVTVVPGRNSQAICLCCAQPAALYDRLEGRRFEFIPLWGYRVFLFYVMRRVRCGVKVEQVPWARGKRELTEAYQQFLAHWAKKLPWKEVALSFRTSWEKVFQAVESVVQWGLAQRDLSGITAIGVDEIAWRKGHHYLTLVYQIDAGRTPLLWVGQERTTKTLLRFFRFFGAQRSQALQYVCSDMWKPYLKVIQKKAGQAVHILDRYHIVAKLNKAIDTVRASEHRQMQTEGYEPLLTNARWCLLKRPENLTEKQEAKLSDLLQYNLKSVRAYLLKEDFTGFWDYVSPLWTEKFLDRWCTRVMRSKLEPMKTVAKSIRHHKPLILNWFRAKKAFSSAVVEGLNNKAKVTTRNSYGFRTYKGAEIALYHALGNLPTPPMTHRFC